MYMTKCTRQKTKCNIL